MSFVFNSLTTYDLLRCTSTYRSINVLNPKDESGAALESDLPANSRLEILHQSHGDDTSLKPEDAAAASSGSFKFLGIACIYRIIGSYFERASEAINFILHIMMRGF